MIKINRSRLKEQIKKKFKTQAKFCELAKYDPRKLQILFAVAHPNEVELKNVSQLIRRTTSGFGKNDLTPKILKAFQVAIDDLGGVKKFCEDYNFNIFSVHQILNGTRKKLSPQIRSLAETLKVSLNGKEEGNKE